MFIKLYLYLSDKSMHFSHFCIDTLEENVKAFASLYPVDNFSYFER